MPQRLATDRSMPARNSRLLTLLWWRASMNSRHSLVFTRSVAASLAGRRYSVIVSAPSRSVSSRSNMSPKGPARIAPTGVAGLELGTGVGRGEAVGIGLGWPGFGLSPPLRQRLTAHQTAAPTATARTTPPMISTWT